MTCPCCSFYFSESWPASNLARCYLCGHIWQVDREPFNYGENYISERYTTKAAPSLEMAWLRLGVLAKFVRSGRVLDVGYGDGQFVRQALRAGYDAKGFDTHDDAFAHIPTERELKGEWAAVTLFDALEHFVDPSDVFAVSARFFIVTIPHTPEDVDDDTVQTWRHYKPNEHLHYFSPVSLRYIFARHGYELAETYPVEDLIRKNPAHNPNTMTYVFRRLVE